MIDLKRITEDLDDGEHINNRQVRELTNKLILIEKWANAEILFFEGYEKAQYDVVSILNN